MDLKALYRISYGVYVVCSRSGEKYNGQIANTVVQVASEPPTVSVSLNKKNLTHEFVKESGFFTVSILSRETPLSFIGRFGFKSGREFDKFDGINFRIGVTGVPVVLENAVAYIELKVKGEIDAGTHTVFLGEVVEAGVLSEGDVMTYEYYHQVKKGTTPVTAPSYAATSVVSERKVKEPVRYRCTVCGYIYDPETGDPENGIKAGTAFEDLPESWVCPVCGAPKEDFKKV